MVMPHDEHDDLADRLRDGMAGVPADGYDEREDFGDSRFDPTVAGPAWQGLTTLADVVRVHTLLRGPRRPTASSRSSTSFFPNVRPPRSRAGEPLRSPDPM